MSVAVRLYRQLNRARREYRNANIPLVGVVGFNHYPLPDIGRHLVGVFREQSVEQGAAPSVSDGFRALRHVQQQLQVLKSCEDETREALRHWFDLCWRWAHVHRALVPAEAVSHGAPWSANGLHGDGQPNDVSPIGSGILAVPTSSNAGVDARDGSGTKCGGGAGVSEVSVGPDRPAVAGRSEDGLVTGGAAWGKDGDGGGTHAALVRRLALLSASLEEGALLVDQLYEANHLSLEDFDLAEGQDGGGGAEEEGATDAAKVGPSVASAGAAQGSGAPHTSRPLLPAPPAWLTSVPACAARRQLDELAAAVAAAHPALFPGGLRAAPGDAAHCIVSGSGLGGIGGSGTDGGGASGGHVASGASGTAAAPGEACSDPPLRAQLEAISQVLFQQLKFRHEPFEWVYDGLAPALVPKVLERRKGIPLSLAVLYCCVSRRLGVAAGPVKATSEGQPGVAEGPIALHGLPPEVAARQGAGRSLALAPPLDSWLVAAVPLRADQRTSEVLFVDVDRRGRVMSGAEARQRYIDMPAAPLSQLLPPAPVWLWAELAAVMRTAHTRRGESDLVAHWLVQVLALDHRSPEWTVVMPQQASE